jgi:hypothetical protein
MATLTVTNLSSAPVFIGDLYTTVPVGGSITTTRNATDLPAMHGLQAAIVAGSVAASIQYSTTESGSGFVGQGEPAGPATGLSTEIVVRTPLTSGGSSGTADDVVVYALNALPAPKLRIIDAYAILSTVVASSHIQLYTQAAAAGTLVTSISSATAGRAGTEVTDTATVVITNGSTVGLFAHRTDRSVVGELFVVLRPEI